MRTSVADADPGDRLILTKPLGTGIITTAAKLTGPGETRSHRRERRARQQPDLDVRHLDEAIISMSRLNRDAARAAQTAGVRAATDITGFGLLGHASEMAMASARDGVGFRIRAADVPILPGAADYAAADYLTRGSGYNPGEFGEHVRFASDVPALQRTLLWEAETSGGLLLAVPASGYAAFVEACSATHQPYWEIGEVVAGAGIEVFLAIRGGGGVAGSGGSPKRLANAVCAWAAICTTSASRGGVCAGSGKTSAWIGPAYRTNRQSACPSDSPCPPRQTTTSNGR